MSNRWVQPNRLGDGRAGRKVATCSVEGCTRPGGRGIRIGRPVCEMHYQHERYAKAGRKPHE